MSLPEFHPGQMSIPASQMQELVEMVRRNDSAIGGTGNNLLNSVSGNIQAQPAPDNWWIQINSLPGSGGGSGSGAGTGAQSAPYGWVTVERNGITYSIMNDMPSGTVTNFPAYEQNGNRNVPIGSVVRAWVTEKDTTGVPCVQFCYESGTASNNCNAFAKMLVDVCGTSFPLKKIYAIVRLCDGAIMSVSCADTVACGSPCPPSCDCSAYQCMTFTVSGIQSNCTSASGIIDCSAFNQVWCLTRSLIGNGYQQTLATGEFAVITILPDCSAILELNKRVPSDCGCGDPSGCVTFGRYFCSSFSCSSGCTFSLIESNVVGCKTWPTTIAVTPSSCCISSGGGGGANSCWQTSACNATTFKVNTSGFSDGTCTNCAAANVTDFILNSLGSCRWSNETAGSMTCSGIASFVSFVLVDDGIGNWELFVNCGSTAIATYRLDYASWSCTGVNTMVLIASGAGCVVPATVTVQKAS